MSPFLFLATEFVPPFLRHINRQCPWGWVGELGFCLCAPLTNSPSAGSQAKPSSARQIAGTIPDSSLVGPLSSSPPLRFSSSFQAIAFPQRLLSTALRQPVKHCRHVTSSISPLQNHKPNPAPVCYGYSVIFFLSNTIWKSAIGHPPGSTHWSAVGSPPMQAHQLTYSKFSGLSYIKEPSKRVEREH